MGLAREALRSRIKPIHLYSSVPEVPCEDVLEETQYCGACLSPIRLPNLPGGSR
jgi:hypothetical protein